MFGDPMKMNDEIKKVLTDYFDAWDLVDLLEINTEAIVDAFEDMVEDRLDELLEHAGYDPEEEDDSGTE